MDDQVWWLEDCKDQTWMIGSSSLEEDIKIFQDYLWYDDPR